MQGRAPYLPGLGEHAGLLTPHRTKPKTPSNTTTPAQPPAAGHYSTRRPRGMPMSPAPIHVIALVALGIASASEWFEEAHVVALGDDNFTTFVKSHKLALVEFYSPWCEKCKELTPKWSEAAKQAKELDPPVPLAKVDAYSGNIADTYDVTGYPQIKLFKDGSPTDYKGARETDAIFAFVKKHALSKLPELKTEAELSAQLLTSGDTPLLLGLFRMPLAASAAFQTFKSAALELGGQPIACAFSASYTAPPVLPLLSDGKKPAVPGLLLMGKDGSVRAALPVPRIKTDFTIEYIVNWLKSQSVQVKYEPDDSSDFADVEYDPDDEESRDYDRRFDGDEDEEWGGDDDHYDD